MHEYRRAGGFLFIVLAVSLAGCTTYSPPEERPPVEVHTPEPEVVTPAPPPRPREPPVSAHQSLLSKARAATAEGDYATALALLERAQRIDPDDAEIYLNLARTHSARGDAAMARASAERGLLYCVSAAQCRALRVFTGNI